MATKNLLIRGGADFSGIKREMEKTQKTLNDFKSNVSKTMKSVGAILATFGIGKVLKDSLDFYDYLTTQEAKLATVMRSRLRATDESIKSMKEFIGVQESLGVVAVEAITAGAQELATYLEEASSLKTLIPVMNDLVAQQFGINASGEQVATVATMVGKVMDGQLGALRRYGFTFDEAQEKILTYGNEAQRAALLAEIVADSIGNMNEALANTPQGRAMQVANEFAGLKYQIGTTVAIFRDLLLPVLSKVISFASAAAVKLQQVGLFFKAIFGKGSASDAQVQTKATTAQTTAVGGLGDAFDDVGEKAKKAGKEAKKASGSFASFDEVNTLAEKNDKSTGSDKDGADGGSVDFQMPDTGPLEDVFPQISEKVQALAEKVRGFFSAIKDFFSGLGSFISNHKDIIISALGGIAAGLATYVIATNGAGIAMKLWNALVLVSTTVLNGLKAAFAFLTGPIGLIVVAITALVAAFIYFYRTNETFRGFVDGILNKIKDAAIFLWEKALVPLGEFLANAFVAAWEATKKAAEWVWKNILVPLGDFLIWFWKNVLVPIGAVLSDVLSVAFKFVAEVAKSFWQNVLVPLGEFFRATFGPTVEAISAVFKFLWETILVPLGVFIAGTLKAQWTVITAVIEFLWKNVLKPLVEFIGGHFINVFRTTFEAVGELIKGAQTIFEGLLKFITGVFTGNWRDAWEGVKQIFKGVFDSLYTIVKTPLNLIIDAINTVISGLNSISIDVPDWVPGFGGKTFGMNVSRIPKLARGGIVTGTTNFGNYIAGEAGTEMIVPLENTPFVDKLASALGTAVMSAMQISNSNQSGGSGGEIVFNVDGTTFARILKPYLAREDQRIGSTIIKPL